MAFSLRYWDGTTLIFGGAYEDWQQLLAMIPLTLTAYPWTIRAFDTDVAYLTIRLPRHE